MNNLGDNDIYRWYLAASGGSGNDGDENNNDQGQDLKLSLIWPCTEQHIKKYSDQLLRMVTETPEVYREHIQPYMSAKREEGRLNWVFNILEGRTEQEDVILRDQGHDGNSDLGFLVLPDLNWDRKTMGSLHLLALVQRRDIWSLRDLTKKHVPWLRYLQTRILEAMVEKYPALEADQLKLYVHCKCDLPFSVLRSLVHELIFYPDQPTYYHFHIHIVNVMLEAGSTQATGKAFGLENLISQLETMSGDDNASLADVNISYFVGEASELWTDIFAPLKQEKTPAPSKWGTTGVCGAK